MKNFWLLGVLVVGFAPASLLAEQLTEKAHRHVNRVSAALQAVAASPSSSETNGELGAAIMALISDQSRSGDEALAALAGHYLGESAELECEILARGGPIVPYLLAFSRSPPPVALKASSVHTRLELVAQIKSGQQCE